MSEQFTNNAETTLNGALDNSQTNVVVTSATGFPTSGEFRIIVKAEGGNTDEIMTVTAVSGTTYTVVRASEATAGVQTASAHASGATVAHVVTAGSIRALSNQAFIGARVYRTTDQTGVVTSTDTRVAWDNESYDTDNFHDNSTNNSRLTIPAGLGGKYHLSANVIWDTNTSNQRHIWFFKNGAGVGGFDRVPASTQYVSQNISDDLDFVPGDYVEVNVWQDSGSNRTLSASLTGMMEFSIYKIDSGSLGSGIGAVVHRSSGNVALGNNTITAIGFDVEDYDSDGFHDNSTNNTRLTVPAGLGGWYAFGGTFYTDTSGADGILRLNGTTTIGFERIGSGISTVTGFNVVASRYLAVGDYVELCGRNPSGTGNAIYDSAGLPSFWITKIPSGTSTYRAASWASGSTFPSGAITGDRFTRTDRNIDYFYDGSQWLSVTLYRETMGGYDNTLPINTTATTIGRAAIWHTTYNMYIDKLYASFFVSTTNNGSNYWTLDFNKYNAANSPTTIGSFNTSGDSASTWTTKEVSIGAVLDSATYKQLQIIATKTAGAPGAFYCPTAFTYRLVG